MSLLEIFQNLDDKTFEDFINEARSLIPIYAPEWTDHNLHDPGITFIDLFAWLAEMQLYHLNRVTDANYLKFLKLIGIYPFDAHPSRADVTFNNVDHETKISAGTQVITVINENKIIFETEEDFYLNPGKLKSIKTIYNSRIIDNTQANDKEDIDFYAFGENPTEGAELQLGFFTQLPNKIISINFIMSEEGLPPVGYHGDEQLEAVLSIDLAWEYFDNGIWKILSLEKDTTINLTRNGKIVFFGPSRMEKKDKHYWIRCRLNNGHYEIVPLIDKILLNTISVVQIERIEDEDLGIGLGIPDQKVRLKEKPVIKRTALNYSAFSEEDVLDWPGLLKFLTFQVQSPISSPGKRMWNLFDKDLQTLINEWKEDQIPGPELKKMISDAFNKIFESRNLYDEGSFKAIQLPGEIQKLTDNLNILPDDKVRGVNRYLIEAAYPDKIKGNPVIQVQGKTWIEVDDLESSGPDDIHYTFSPEKGEITFGNGLNGRIPPENQGIKALIYKTTQGSRGNIPTGQKFRIEKEGFDGIFGENKGDAVGGMSAESIDHAKDRAKEEFRTIFRTITSNDYEELVCSTPGLRVARAEAIPNFNPEYPCISIPGTVTVVVVPYARGERVTPVPGEGFLQTIRNHLELHRLVTTDVYVIGPEYVKISVMCRVHITKKSSQSSVEERVSKALDGFLDPLKGGPDGKGWPFGRAVFASEIYQLIDNVEGVEYVTNVFLSGEGLEGDYKKGGDIISISPDSLVCNGEHKVITTDLPFYYVKIFVKCEILLHENNRPALVKRSVHKALERFLDPIKGGMDGKGWTSGKAVYTSEIRGIVQHIEGVKEITHVSLCIDGQQYQEYSIKMPNEALAVSGEHQVEIMNRGRI